MAVSYVFPQTPDRCVAKRNHHPGGEAMNPSKSEAAITRRHVLLLAGGAVAAPAVLRVTRAGAAEVTLKLHHFLPATSNCQVRFLKPWADQVLGESDGRLQIDIYPAMSLGGKPPQL